MRCIFSLIILTISMSACTFFRPDDTAPELENMPLQFSLYSEKADNSGLWWKDFNSLELDLLIDEAIAENFSIRESWARLEQARYAARKEASSFWPEASVPAGAADSEIKEEGESRVNVDEWSLGFSASYEVDLWGRIKADTESSLSLAEASREDLKTAVMSVTGQIAENWIALLSTKKQQALFASQMELQKRLLDLIQFRFPLARSTALDIYQQQQSIEKIEAALIPLQSREKALARQLALFMGKASLDKNRLSQNDFPVVDKIPQIGLPADLLAVRPDVRAAGLKLQSARWQIAAAKADRLPALKLTASQTYSSADIGSIFDYWLLNLAANLTAPVFDGKKRRLEVARTEALADERFAAYGRVVFTAIKEVEDALADEEQYAAIIESLDRQLELSEKTMREARRRYLNGSSDFINVLREELNVLQLQQELIVAHENRLVARIKLYKSLGGSWVAAYVE